MGLVWKYFFTIFEEEFIYLTILHALAPGYLTVTPLIAPFGHTSAYETGCYRIFSLPRLKWYYSACLD